MRCAKILVVGMVTLLALSGFAIAQQGGRGGRGGGGMGMRQGGGMRRGPDDRPGPIQMREQMRTQRMERLRLMLNAGDEQWGNLEPRLERVLTLQQETMIRGFGPFRGLREDEAPRTPPIPPEPPQAPVARAAYELELALQNPATSEDEFEARLAALRRAREQNRLELTQAQHAVREMVTARQEVQLVLQGILE